MRARSIKPGICDNEVLGTADPFFSLLFERLWMMADREGRLEDRPLRIKAQAFPYRDGLDVEPMLKWLSENGFILRYSHGNSPYIQILKFGKHQSPHIKEAASSIPAPEQHQTSTVLAPGKAQPKPAPAALTPSSLTPDSGLLTADCMVPTEPVALERATERSPDPVQTVFAHWQSVHRKPKARLDDKRRALIRKALKHYGEADLCQSISGYLNSPHHMGQNQNGTVYDSIELFLRDSKHIDDGLKFYAEPPRTDLSSTTRRNITATAGWRPPELRNAGN